MKKSISIMVLVLSLFFAGSCAYAAEGGVYLEEAQALKQMGLFRGSDQGFELERAPSRVEAAVMLIRILGQEEIALSAHYSHPFNDVPAWANDYIGYMYESNLSKGISATEFGSAQLTSANQYATYILRALGYSDQEGDFIWSEALNKSLSIGFLTETDLANLNQANKLFVRDDMVHLSYTALANKLKGQTITLQDKLAQEGVFDKAAYTIMMYLNGSDLESLNGMATSDLNEILGADFSHQDINMIIQTGGTAQWQNNVIPAHQLARWAVTDNGLELLQELPLASIGDSKTLTDFIDFAINNYPAQKYGLIFWNHGGGSVSGYGVDELFNYDGLSLKELDIAFENSRLNTNQLEFLGFDACLMGNLETANIAKDYASYLIASEELEPGYGWDYDYFLTRLGRNPGMDGKELGANIVDGFISFYQNNGMADEATTLSVIDLKKVPAVVNALESFIDVVDISAANFATLSKPRSKTKEFGMPSAHGGCTDMVDMVDLAKQFQSVIPAPSANLVKAINEAVIYNRMGDYVDKAGGLSMYFPYSAKDEVGDRIPVYQTTGFSPKYIDYVTEYANLLTGTSLISFDLSSDMPEQSDESFSISLSQEELDNIGQINFTAWVKDDENFYTQILQDSYVEIDEYGTIVTEFNGQITTINGEWACLYELDRGEDYVRYGVPAYLNDAEVNIVLLYDNENPNGLIVGAMPVYDEITGMAPKSMIDFQTGDRITMLYYTSKFVDVNDDTEATEEDFYWYEGNTFTLGEELTLETWEVEDGTYLYGFTVVDLQGNEYYTDFIEVAYE